MLQKALFLVVSLLVVIMVTVTITPHIATLFAYLWEWSFNLADWPLSLGDVDYVRFMAGAVSFILLFFGGCIGFSTLYDKLFSD